MRILLAVFALAAAAAAAWLLLAGGGSTTTDWEPDAPAGPSDAPDARRPGPAEGEAASDARGIPTGNASLHGRVTRDGEPVAATVYVTRVREWDPLTRYIRPSIEAAFEWLHPPRLSDADRKASTDLSGEYRFEHLTGGHYRAEAVAPDGAMQVQMFVLQGNPEEREVDFELPEATESLAGRAVHADGRPFLGTVTIRQVLEGGGHGPPRRGVRTGADGSFALAGLPPGPVVLLAVEDRFKTYRGHRIVLPAAEDVLYVVDEGVADVTGRVIAAHDGSPIAGARIAVGGGEGDRQVTDDAVSGEDGTFTVRVDPGVRWIFAEADGYAPVRLAGGRIDPDRIVRLELYGRITGRVIRPDGVPVEGVDVLAVPTGRRSPSDHAFARTGPDGRYEIADALPGELSLVAWGEGCVSPGLGDLREGGYNPFLVTLAPGGEAEVDLEVVRAGAVAGRVVDDRGEPAAGIPVRARITEGRTTFLGYFATERDATDGEGRFEIRDLVPGVVMAFQAEPANRGESSEARVEIVSGETAELVLHLPPRRELLVRVLEKESGAPVSGAVVSVQLGALGGRRRSGGEGVKTDSKGEARIEGLPARALWVRVEHDAYVDLPEAVAVPGSEGDEAELEVEIALEGGLAIRGFLLWPEGSPASGEEVTIRAAAFPRPRVWKTVVTDAEGRFRLGGLPEGSYEVGTALSRDGVWHRAWRTVGAGGDDVLLRLASIPRIAREELRVRVLDPAGRPVRSGRYCFGQRGKRGSTSGSSVLQDGGFEESASSHYDSMWFHVWDVRSVDGTPLAPFVYGPVPTLPGELDLRLDLAGEVSGRVVDSRGEPVRGVKLRALPVLPESVRDRYVEHATAFSGTDGAFLVKGLGAFEYTIAADVPPEYAPVAPVPVRSGARDVVIRLEPGRAVEVLVLAWNDEPAVGVAVSARPVKGTPGRAVAATTDEEGVARLEGLDPAGTYQLHLRPPSAQKDLLRREVADWRPADARFRLERAYVVRGTVRDPSGNPVPDAMVWRKTGETSWRGGETGADGTFEFDSLPAGEVVLRVTVGDSMGGFWGAAEIVTVPAGTEDLEITVDPGKPLNLRFVDAPPGARFLVRLTEESAEDPATQHVSHRGGTTTEIRGLDPAKTWAVYILFVRDGKRRIGYARGAVAGGPEVRVRFVAALTLRGRVNLPEGTERAWATATTVGIRQGSEVLPDGSFEIGDLPPGPLQVTASAIVGETFWTGTATARAGGEVELDLEPQEGSEDR